MPKKKIEVIVNPSKGRKVRNLKLKTPTVRGRAVPAPPAATPVILPVSAAADEDLSQFPPVFENKAGHYELIRVEGGQAYYSFTNRQQHTVDATMSVITWRKMQERAEAALKETA